MRQKTLNRPSASFFFFNLMSASRSENKSYCAFATKAIPLPFRNAERARMDSNEDFDWAWAEREESLAALQDSLTEFYQQDPLYELLWLCFNSPSETIAMDLRDAAALRCPAGFPRLAEGCDLLQACCQNIEVEHALTWLQFCLDNASFDPEQN